MSNWIWFPKRNVLDFQNDTEPKLYPDLYEKYVPESQLAEKDKEIAELRAALEFYASLESWKSDHEFAGKRFRLNELLKENWGPIVKDSGHRARQALQNGAYYIDYGTEDKTVVTIFTRCPKCSKLCIVTPSECEPTVGGFCCTDCGVTGTVNIVNTKMEG